MWLLIPRKQTPPFLQPGLECVSGSSVLSIYDGEAEAQSGVLTHLGSHSRFRRAGPRCPTRASLFSVWTLIPNEQLSRPGSWHAAGGPQCRPRGCWARGRGRGARCRSSMPGSPAPRWQLPGPVRGVACPELCQHLSAAERTSSARNSFPPTTSVALGVRGAAGSAWPHSALVPGSLHLSGTPGKGRGCRNNCAQDTPHTGLGPGRRRRYPILQRGKLRPARRVEVICLRAQ